MVLEGNLADNKRENNTNIDDDDAGLVNAPS
jgi:hypothetical protein